ncbi:Beta-hexosaminidase [Trichuris trichiura]|uniref:Beta-hexosaminidase n=1 Tax=Trichuris trichiura TaxID=36087 RepID=A0A077Z5B1_TRITR|nr:Beta-hexosaminidase [Trichuris trichiura]
MFSRTYGMPWPMPQKFELLDFNLTLTKCDFHIISNYACDILTHALEYYDSVVFGREKKQGGLHTCRAVFGSAIESALLTFEIVVDTPCPMYPRVNMSEHYDLIMRRNGSIVLRAPEVWGALRGLETFSQLVIRGETVDVVRGANVKDYPRFSHRGILLDTARHFLSVEIIKQNIEIMSQNKFNVFHWHIVDDQSFPFESEALPSLSAYGAYSSAHVYHPWDVAEIIEYARLWGVRVVPEFDSPGHMASWGLGKLLLLSDCAFNEQQHYEQLKTLGVIDPTKEENYKILGKIFEEVLTRFKDNYLHLGGDEIPQFCWRNRNKVPQLRKAEKLDAMSLITFHFKNLLGSIKSKVRDFTPVYWHDAFQYVVNLTSKAVFQVWKLNDFWYDVDVITRSGHAVILSSCWYLNFISYKPDWRRFYTCDPRALSSGTRQQRKLIIGGEVCLWGEYVDDTNVLQFLWPRAAAAGERLWSSVLQSNADAALPRL